MSIEILTLGRFEPNDKAVNVALPVLAFECEATPPIENYLDAYEEAVLKLVSIGLSSHGIAGTMNATESLIEEILDNLEQRKYVEKEIGRPWKVTDDGNKYLSGEIGERESDNSQFGYMFVNAIKKDVLPFFYHGDINQIALFRGNALPAKLTVCGDEEKTFEPFTPKRVKLKEAYRRYFKNADTSKQYDDGDITRDEAIDRFEGLDSFDEEEDEPTTLEYVIIAVPVCGEDEQKIISYAKGNGANVMILPLTMFDINSFRRLQNVMLRQIVSLNTGHCPCCGGEMRRRDNQMVCDNCNQLMLTKTICPNPDCRHEYYYLSFDVSAETLSKMKDVDPDNFYQVDSLYQYKDIVNMSVDTGKIRTICPHCGQ